MNIESKLWKVRATIAHSVAVIQKATGATRYVTISHLPDVVELAAMNEAKFDRVCRDVFHEAAP